MYAAMLMLGGDLEYHFEGHTLMPLSAHSWLVILYSKHFVETIAFVLSGHLCRFALE